MKTKKMYQAMGIKSGMVFLAVVSMLVFGSYEKAFASYNYFIMDDKAKDGRVCQTLYAGQTIEAGTVCIEMVDTSGDGYNDAMRVTYETAAGWQLTEAHLWIGDEISQMPQTRQGNPKIGNFPYNSGDITGATTYHFDDPICCLGFDCVMETKKFYIAAHASLRAVDANGNPTGQTETGWMDGDRFVIKGMWGTYFTTTVTCKTPQQTSPICETAFAYDPDNSTCFLDIDENGDDKGDFNRWGWTNKVQLGGASTSFIPIYAGAGQCDITKGTLVGQLKICVNGQTVQAGYLMTEGSPYTMNEIQTYIGKEILPRDKNNEFTVAPGQYSFINDELKAVTTASTRIFEFAAEVTEVYVVAHAVVCYPAPK